MNGRGWIERGKIQVVAKTRDVVRGRDREAVATLAPPRPGFGVACIEPAIVIEERLPPGRQGVEQRFLILERSKRLVTNRGARAWTRLLERRLQLLPRSSHGGGRGVTLFDGKVDAVAAASIHDAEQTVPAAHEVPLEDPHERRQLQPGDPHFALGERADVEAGEDRLPGLGQNVYDGVGDSRVVAEPRSRPRSRQLAHVGLRVDREVGRHEHVRIGPQPETVQGIEGSRPGPERSAKLREQIGADDPWIRSAKAAQGARMFLTQKIGKRAGPLELRFRLKLDDPSMTPSGESRIQWQIAEEVAGREFRGHDERRRLDASEDRFVHARIDVQAPELADSHRPTPKHECLVSRFEQRQQSAKHGLQARGGANAHFTSIRPVSGVIEVAAFAKADHHSRNEGHLVEQLFEPGAIDVPDGRIRRIDACCVCIGRKPAKRPGQGRGQRQHVGVEEHLHATPACPVEQRPEPAPDGGMTREKRTPGVIDRDAHRRACLIHTIEVHQLEQQRHRDRVVAVVDACAQRRTATPARRARTPHHPRTAVLRGSPPGRCGDRASSPFPTGRAGCRPRRCPRAAA